MAGTASIVALLVITSVASLFVVKIYNARMSASKVGLIAADRNLGKWEAALSVAASWIWAPSLFVSAQKSYQDGVLGLFWFVVPNILCLIFFAYFAEKVRRDKPDGFTISDYILHKTSHRVQFLYWVTLVGLAVCAFAVQLLAGGQLLSKFTGIPYFWCCVILSLVPLSYSIISGLKATIVTDVFKMLFIYGVGLLLIPWVLFNSGGPEVIFEGLGGKIGSTDFFGAESLRVFLTFGLPATIGLLAGPFGDQTFWQRAFSIQKEYVKASFVRGAFLFAVVPLLMSTLGFIAAGTQSPIKDPQMVNIEVISRYLPLGATWIFVFMILAALISILDTKLASIGSLGGHDFTNHVLKSANAPYAKVMLGSRLSMVLLVLVALAIANIPNIKILHLFLFYGTMRSATVFPTVLLVLGKSLPEKGVFYGILASLLIGLPLFAYGNLQQIPVYIVLGSLLTVLLSGFVAWGWPSKKA